MGINHSWGTYLAHHECSIIKIVTVIIAKTIKGKGVSYMENKVKWHYSTPSRDELQIAINDINNA